METLTIIQQNVQYWPTRKFNLTNTYLKLNPDIVLINSHGITDNMPIKIQGYQSYTINKLNEIHDGIAILIKNNIKHTIQDEFITNVLQVTIETTLGKISLATTYLPPRRPYLPYPDIHKLASNHHPTYLLADLNAHHRLLNNNRNNEVGKGLERFMRQGKLIHLGPNFPTFHGRSGGSTPDLVFSNSRAHHNITITPGPLTEADHIPIIMNITAKAITKIIPPILNLKAANWERFKEEVDNNRSDIGLNEHLTKEEIDNKIQEWYSKVEAAIHNNIPKKNTQTLRKPITSPLLRQVQHQYKELLNEANMQGWGRIQYYRYRMLKVMLKNESDRLYNKNWEDLIKQTAEKYKDPPAFWAQIKKMRGSENSNNQHLEVNNTKLVEEKDKERAFREIWSKVFTISPEENMQYNLNKEREIEGYWLNNEEQRTPFPSSDINRITGREEIDTLISTAEIKYAIKSFKNNTPGESPINKLILKNLPDSAIENLKTLFNLTVSTGYFPDKFKTAIIKLLPKANTDQTNPINYRPISLLEVTGKILEKIINKRLRNYLEQNNHLPSFQHGFRRNRGTDTALTVIHETIAHHTARRDQVYLVLRDVSKAFDKVWHAGLQYKIVQLQLPNTITRLLNNYIKGRKAKIKIGSYTGQEFPLTAGVPQGSSLSPTLYTIYTADLPLPEWGCTNIQYADDITQIITYPGASRGFMSRLAVREITKINKFEEDWKIKTNKNKFKIIPIAVKKKDDIIIEGTKIDYSLQGKVLGLTIGRTGIERHVTEIIAKSKKRLSELYRFRKLPEKIRTHLIKAFILPLLQYPPIPLVTISKTKQGKLQKVLNQALRFAYDERYPYRRPLQTLHEHANIKPINYTLYERASAILEKTQELGDPHMDYIIDNYEIDKTHLYFGKTKKVLDRGPPELIYATH